MRYLMLIVFLFLPVVLAGGTLSLKTEYRTDVLDYDDEAESFFRFSGRWQEPEKLDSFYTYVRKNTEDENSFSTGLMLGTELLDFYVGDYYLCAGSGMVLGRRRYIPPDLFTRASLPVSSKWLSSDKSGRPMYSFRGAAGGLNLVTEDFAFSLRSFISRRERYINADDSYTGCADCTIGTLLSHYSEDVNHTGAVYLCDQGVLCDLKSLRFLNFQAYVFETCLEDFRGNKLLWKSSVEQEEKCLVKDMRSMGCYARYNDNYLDLFYDLGCISCNDSEGGERTGIIWRGGFLIRHDFFRIRLWKQKADKHAETPYGSDGSTPRDIEDCAITIKIRNFRAGCFAQNENTLIPPGTQASPVSNELHGCLLGYSGKIFDFRGRIKEIKKEQHAGTEEYRQYRLVFKAELRDRFSMRLKGLFQSHLINNVDDSFGACLSIKYHPCNRISFSLFGGMYSVSEGNEIYVSYPSLGNPLSSGGTIRGNSRVWGFIFDLRKEIFYSGLRYERSIEGEGGINQCFEFYFSAPSFSV